MRISIGDLKLYVDVDGAGLVIDGQSMRERPTLPLYTQRPQPPEVAARMTRNLDVAAHFRHTGGEMLFDYRDRLHAIRCPLLVMAGSLDPMVTIEDARELAAALPPSTTRFVEFPTAGHMLALEDPEAVIRLMVDFIEA